MLLLTASLALASLPTPEALRAIPDPRAHREARLHGPRPGPQPERAPPTVDGSGYDVRDTVLRVHIDPDARTVEASAAFTVDRVAEGDLILHADGPDIGEVRVDGVVVTWNIDGDEVHVPVDGGTALVEVEWTWRGMSARDGGLQWGDPIFSFHEPEAARRWLVVRDVPSDKTTLRWEVTVPSDRVVAANGLPLGTSPAEAGYTTWIFGFDAPIATYLMVVHVGDYQVLDLTDGGGVPVTAWVYPGLEEEAQEAFGTTSAMLDHFSALYNPYPWWTYGNALAPFGGAMEHTTCTTFSEGLMGDDFAELVNAHELGHHWWGDSVTLGTWADIWLNEGFASYTEALWYEDAYGQEGLTAYARYQAESYFRWNEYEGEFPIYDPDYMWGGTVYDKGALVLHMLRGVLGDERFFRVLQDYEARYHLGTAVTTDFIASVEQTVGEDMGWFFDPWLYTAGEPTYTWSWAAQPAAEGWQLDVSVAQDRTDFRMPVPLRIQLADGTTVDTSVEVAGDGGRATLCLATEPVGVELDPDFWVLVRNVDEVSGAPGALSCGVEDTGAPDEDSAVDSGAGLPSDGVRLSGGGCGCAAAGGTRAWAASILALAAVVVSRRGRRA